MKGIQLKQFGIGGLQLAALPIPVIQANEVLIRVNAAALNYVDLALIRGSYYPGIALPHLPASDAAGIVEAVGSEVKKWKRGDRVTTHFIQRWASGAITAEANTIRTGVQTPGVLAEYIAIPEYALVRSPDTLSDEEAATLPVAGLTAWNGLMVHGKLEATQTLLTQGTGGVSIFALQIARALGAHIIATSGKEDKLSKLKALGADDVINYKSTPDLAAAVKSLSRNEGADMTIDVAGTDSIIQSMKSVKLNGFVGLIGFLSGSSIPFDVFTAIRSFINLKAFSVGSRDSFEDFIRFIDQHKIKPVVDRVFPLEDTAKAYQYMEQNAHFGKVVVKI